MTTLAIQINDTNARILENYTKLRNITVTDCISRHLGTEQLRSSRGEDGYQNLCRARGDGKCVKSRSQKRLLRNIYTGRHRIDAR